MAMLEVWRDGRLTARWNETTKRIEYMAADGVTVASSVAMTSAQSAEADAYVANRAATANEASIRTETAARLVDLQTIIDTPNASLFTQSGTASALKLLARTLRLVIRLLIRRLDGIT